jgi:RPA family protein
VWKVITNILEAVAFFIIRVEELVSVDGSSRFLHYMKSPHETVTSVSIAQICKLCFA